MPRRLRFALLAWLLAWLAAAAAAEPLVLVTSNYPPYAYLEDGKPKGIAVELVTEAFARLQREIRIELLPVPRAIEDVRNGRADGIFPFALDAERRRFAEYPSQPLLKDPGVLVVRADMAVAFDGDFAKLAGYTFGMQRGTNQGPDFADAVKRLKLRVDTATDQQLNIEKLLARRFDIAVGPSLVIRYTARRLGKESDIRILSPAISEGTVYVAFSRYSRHRRLLDQLDRVIEQMRADGAYERIYGRHSMAPAVHR